MSVRPFAEFRSRFRSLVSPQRADAEMEKEMRLHLEMEIEENVRRGMTPEAARRTALLAFGGVERHKEDAREERGTPWLEQMLSDIRQSLRGMRSQPAFAATIIGLLALGTGANAAIYSAVHRLILHPLPYAHSDRFVQMLATTGGGRVLITPTKQLITTWRDRSQLVEQVGIAVHMSASLGDTLVMPRQELDGAAIGPGMMRMVEMRPQLGRDVIPADTAAGAPSVVIVGDGAWRRYLGTDRSIVGKMILLDGVPRRVIGVAPRGFGIPFTDGSDFFIPITRSFRWEPVGRLKPGVSLDAAKRELATLTSAMERERGNDPPTLTDQELLTSGGTRRMLFVLFAAVGFVLLIACANIANLLLTRAWSRQREFAVRAAMGATRGRIVRQLFTESLMFALVGGGLGLIVGAVMLDALVKLSILPDIEKARLNFPVVAWSLGLAVVTGFVFGLAPAWLLGVGRIGELLKASARSTSEGRRARRVRGLLVVAEVALSVMLLVGTGLMLRSLRAISSTDMGVETRGVAAMSLRMPREFGTDSVARRDALASILGSVRRAPGIDMATLALSAPPDFLTGMGNVEIEGASSIALDSLRAIQLNVTTPEYFRTVGIRVLQGRVYAENTRLSSSLESPEVMINERFARRFWPAGNAVGSRIRYAGSTATIVGVVNDVALPGSERSPMQLYLMLPAAPQFATIIVRSSLPAARLDSVLRAAVVAGNARVRGEALTSPDIQRRQATRRPALVARLLGGFAALAVLLAAIGLHAVIAYAVKQREREIGIRIALGATSTAVGRMIFGTGMKLTLGGVVLGALGAVYGTRVMRGLLFGVEPGDPATIAISAVLLVGTAAIACAIPARRATRVDPVELVRAE